MSELKTIAEMPEREQHGVADCRFGEVALSDAVAYSTAGQWDLPDYQRGFVWKPSQVALIADSLWRNYPIGFVLLWTDGDPDGLRSLRAWIADGQQRLTALCMLFGEKPQWWERRAPSVWESLRARYDIRFDIEGDRADGTRKSRFIVGSPDLDPGRFIPLSTLLTMNPLGRDGAAALQAAGARVKALGHCRGAEEEEVVAQLRRVASLRNASLMVAAVQHELREVLEIFDRLNSRGMKFRRVLLTVIRQALSALGGGPPNPVLRDTRGLKPR